MFYVGNIIGFYLKILRSDRGGEFTSNEFNGYCKNEGIHNGVAERKNRTIFEMAKSMLKAKHLQKPLWAEAVSCPVYLLNRCPTKSVRGRTPEEAWSLNKPDFSLASFWVCCIPDEKRKTLDDKSKKCIFIGYSDITRGYKLYNSNTSEVTISRYAVC